MFVDLLEECRGKTSKVAFAKTLGISHRMLSAIYSGERRPGRRVLTGLINLCPDKRDQIMALFFSPDNGHDRATESTVAPESAVPA